MPMTITRCYKFRLEPTAEQEHAFLRFAGCRRYVWNWSASVATPCMKFAGNSEFGVSRRDD